MESARVLECLAKQYAAYRLANDMWQVKHLNGLTFVSEMVSEGLSLKDITIGHTGENMSFEMFVPGERVAAICAENHCETKGWIKGSMVTRTCSDEENRKWKVRRYEKEKETKGEKWEREVSRRGATKALDQPD